MEDENDLPWSDNFETVYKPDKGYDGFEDEYEFPGWDDYNRASNYENYIRNGGGRTQAGARVNFYRANNAFNLSKRLKEDKEITIKLLALKEK
ncbi:hypothetical protein ABKT97_14485 [Enterobacter hormaechei]